MNNKAILNKLIDLGRVKEIDNGFYATFDMDFQHTRTFNPILRSADAELIKSALFDVCAKQGLFIKICNNTVDVYDCTLTFEEEEENIETIYQGDTSRESFVAAFCKVVGV